MASMLPVIRTLGGKKYADFIDARDPATTPSMHTARAVDRMKTYTLTRQIPANLPDNPRQAILQFENTTSMMTGPEVELFAIGDDLTIGQALIRFLNQMRLRQQIRGHYSTVGETYGRLITRNPSLGNGLYVKAQTSRRSTTGWMVSTSRSKSSYQVQSDPMSEVLASTPTMYYYARNTATVDDVWDAFTKSFIRYQHTGRDIPESMILLSMEADTERYNSKTADLTVLLPRDEAVRRTAELAPIRAALTDVSAAWKKRRNAAVQWATTNKDLMAKYTKTTERLKAVLDTGSEEWNNLFRYDHDKGPLVTEFVTSLVAALEDETLVRVHDHVRAQAWAQVGGALSEDDQKEIDSADWEAFDTDTGKKMWDAYVADNPLTEITH